MLLLVAPSYADQFDSGIQKTVLIELFTSQGCNSCPPAESYLNSFVSHQQLWKTYIPVAFHVDYWDYLGWKDRFADPVHRTKQEVYARFNRQNTIYTPGFYVNGQPWRRGLFKRDPAVTQQKPGNLSLVRKDNLVTAQFQPANKKVQPATLHVVVLGMNLKTDIRAGENAGRNSQHDFVVLEYHQLASNNYQWQLALPEMANKETDRLALAAWVTGAGDPRPLQAVGGYLTQH